VRKQNQIESIKSNQSNRINQIESNRIESNQIKNSFEHLVMMVTSYQRVP
jgi:hypothetical protein